MLPELPFAFILHLVNIIMRYPVRIAVETTVRQVVLLELIICVYYGLYMILVFHNM